MPQRIFTFKKGGKTYEMPWDKEGDPSPLDAKQFAWEQDNPKPKGVADIAGEAFDWANKPIADVISPDMRGKARDAFAPNSADSPTSARLKGFAGGSIEALGDTMSSMSSPLSLGLGAVTGGTAAAKGLGFGRTASALTNVERGAGAALATHGGYKMYKAGNSAERAGAFAEMAGGLAGMRGEVPDITEAPREVRPTVEPPVSTPERAQPKKLYGDLRDPNKPVRFEGGSSGWMKDTLHPVIDADFSEVPKFNIQKEAPKQLALPPGKDPLYQGRRGTSTNIEAVTDQGLPGDTQAQKGFNALIPERFKPRPSNLGTTGHFEYVPPALSDVDLGNVGEKEPVAPPPEKVTPKRDPLTAGMSDDDVAFLAESGDKKALAEAAQRPTLKDKLKHLFNNEVGAVGDLKNDPLNPENRSDEGPVDEAGRRLGGRTTVDEKGPLPAGTQAALREMGVPEDRIQKTDIATAAEMLKSPTAKFKGMQEDVTDTGDRTEFPLFDVQGGVNHGSTVSEQRLKDLSIEVPTDRTPQPKPGERGFSHLLNDETGAIKFAGRTIKVDSPYMSKFADWVNSRKATTVEGMLKRREFTDLDSAGPDAIHAFQTGDRTGRLKDVKDYFTGKFKELQDAGVPLTYKENYLPQLWDNSMKEIKEGYRRLGLKPSFTLKSIFQDYEAGIQAGLKPKFEKMSDLIGWYEGKANKAIADRKFYDLMKQEDWIRPQGKGEADWKVLDSNHFPHAVMRKRGSDTVTILPMTAPPELHEIISNYLNDPNKIMQWMADKSSMTKNFAMSSGVPFTGINAHGANILARTVIGDPKSTFRAGKFILNPKTAGRYLEANLHTAPEAVKSGLSLTTEGHEMGVSGSTNLAGRTFQKGLKLQGKLFEDPLFQNVIPALKLKHWTDMVGELEKSGMDREQAKKVASKTTNSLYGGVNWEATGRNRDIQNLARMLVLAPDWLESNAQMGKGIAKALLDPKNPQGKFYAKASRNLIGAYVSANIVNYAINGRNMWDNDPGHALDIQIGEENGKKRWLRPFGTAADFLRLPFDVAASAVKGDLGEGFKVLKNRESIPVNTINNFIDNQTDQGRPMYGKDVYGRKIPVGKQVTAMGAEASQLVTPPYVKGAFNYMTGNQPLEEALTSTAEMPIRYSAESKKKHSTSRSERKSR